MATCTRTYRANAEFMKCGLAAPAEKADIRAALQRLQVLILQARRRCVQEQPRRADVAELARDVQRSHAVWRGPVNVGTAVEAQRRGSNVALLARDHERRDAFVIDVVDNGSSVDAQPRSSEMALLARNE